MALNKYGLDHLGTAWGFSPQKLVELGQDIYNDLHRGKSAATETDDTYRMAPKITDKQSANLVSAAQFTICLDTLS